MANADLSALIGYGATGAKPAAGIAGRLYFDTSLNQLQRDNGSSWDAAEGVASSGIPTNGWNAGTGTWSYSSADSPIFVISVNNDQTGIIGVGMLLKWTQATGGTKYGIVHAVGAYSGGVTLITVYGGTDYTLTNEAITSPYWSNVAKPLGFPLNPDKWSVEVTSTSDVNQGSPANGTWYNVLSISGPIGLWKTIYQAAPYCNKAGTQTGVYVTLSTANNSESNVDFTALALMIGASSSMYIFETVFREKILSLASKTTQYLNIKSSGNAEAGIGISGNNSKTIIRLVDAYL